MQLYSPAALGTRGTPFFYSNQVSITASTGVGKTSLIRELKLLWPDMRFSSGGTFMRKLGQSLGFKDIRAFAAHNKAHPEDGNDRKCDALICALGNDEVFEGRLPHIFMPMACHILLECPLDIRIDRRWRDEKEMDRKEGKPERKREVTAAEMNGRIAADKRYDSIYPDSELWTRGDFDFVVSTEFNSPSTTAHMIANYRTYQWCPWLDAAHRLIHERTFPGYMPILRAA